MLYALNLYSDVCQVFLTNTGKREVLYCSHFSSINPDQNLYFCAYLKNYFHVLVLSVTLVCKIPFEKLTFASALR